MRMWDPHYVISEKFLHFGIFRMEINNQPSSSNDEKLLEAVLWDTILMAGMDDEDNDSSDSDPGFRGSTPGRASNLRRTFLGTHGMIVWHYFSGAESLYNEEIFQFRFGLPRAVINRVVYALIGKYLFIFKRGTAGGRLGICSLVFIVTSLRMLVYGDAADHLDEILQISETVYNESLCAFSRLVVEKFGHQYLNKFPTAEQKVEVLELMKRRGFPGCAGSWDCKHYLWKNCPASLAGQHKGKEKKKTLVMEDMCDLFMYIWYFNFGAPGSLNDIKILDQSSIFGALISGTFDNKVPP